MFFVKHCSLVSQCENLCLAWMPDSVSVVLRYSLTSWIHFLRNRHHLRFSHDSCPVIVLLCRLALPKKGSFLFLAELERSWISFTLSSSKLHILTPTRLWWKSMCHFLFTQLSTQSYFFPGNVHVGLDKWSPNPRSADHKRSVAQYCEVSGDYYQVRGALLSGPRRIIIRSATALKLWYYVPSLIKTMESLWYCDINHKLWVRHK